MIHYRAGIEDIESSEVQTNTPRKSASTQMTQKDLDSEITQLIDSQPFSSISDDLFGPSESV